jgi:cyclic pyranopterin phosphate synthase
MSGKSGTVQAVCISEKKGVQKHPVSSAMLIDDFGIDGDAHAGPGHRQVSLLATESVETIRARGASVSDGDFGENILTEGVDLKSVVVGDTLRIGAVRLVVTQVGKQCHHRCAIFDAAGTCVMPTDGVFCRVSKGGEVRVGDEVRRL